MTTVTHPRQIAQEATSQAEVLSLMLLLAEDIADSLIREYADTQTPEQVAEVREALDDVRRLDAALAAALRVEDLAHEFAEVA